jgi:quercetin dioxygenase-like cupin family protein
MKRLNPVVVALAIAVTILLIVAATPKKAAPKDRVIPADQMRFEKAVPGVSKSVLWGDPAKGTYGAITHFDKGTKVGWHTHPHDIKAVVISGTMLYDNGSGEQRLGPGSFLQERSTIKHTTAAGDDDDLVFFEEGSGPFDIKMVK